MHLWFSVWISTNNVFSNMECQFIGSGSKTSVKTCQVNQTKTPLKCDSFFCPEIVRGNRELHSCQLEVWRQPRVHTKGLFSPCCSSNEPTAQVEGLLCYDSHNHYHYNHLYCNDYHYNYVYCNDYNYKYICCNDYNYSNTQPWRFAFSINPAFLSPLVSPTFCRLPMDFFDPVLDCIQLYLNI